jgi:hypothetical protein
LKKRRELRKAGKGGKGSGEQAPNALQDRWQNLEGPQ